MATHASPSPSCLEPQRQIQPSKQSRQAQAQHVRHLAWTRSVVRWGMGLMWRGHSTGLKQNDRTCLFFFYPKRYTSMVCTDDVPHHDKKSRNFSITAISVKRLAKHLHVFAQKLSTTCLKKVSENFRNEFRSGQKSTGSLWLRRFLQDPFQCPWFF